MNRPIYRLLAGEFGARVEIGTLIRRTAKAFGEEAPKTAGLSSRERLKCYATYTQEAARRAMQSEQDPNLLHEKLYQMALRLGSSLRRWLRPKDEKECFDILRLLYRHIGITLREGQPGEDCVDTCYFSSFYTPETCLVISAVDQGVFAGVCGGGRLTFRERITEGQRMCRADFQ